MRWSHTWLVTCFEPSDYMLYNGIHHYTTWIFFFLPALFKTNAHGPNLHISSLSIDLNPDTRLLLVLSPAVWNGTSAVQYTQNYIYIKNKHENILSSSPNVCAFVSFQLSVRVHTAFCCHVHSFCVCVCVIARPHTAEQRRERLTACYVKCTESFPTSAINPPKTKDWQTSAPERLIKFRPKYTCFFFFLSSNTVQRMLAAPLLMAGTQEHSQLKYQARHVHILLLCMKIFLTANCSCNTYINSSKLTQSSNIWSMYLDIKR